MRRVLRSLARDERGTSLIEFGFLVPFLALLTMGVIDLSRGLAERFALQQAVNRGLELVQARPAVASATSGDVDYSFVEDEVEAAAKEIGKEPVQVTLERWLECNGGSPKDVNSTCATGEAVARYLRVRVTKNFTGDFYYKTIPMAASGTLRTQ
jgi:Flp pilus assembly pilin Flp